MRPRVVLLGALLALSTSCAVDRGAREADEGARAAAPIVNGQNDDGHPFSVALTTQGQAFCSGTLVSPTVVVTAAHCIFPGIGIDPPQVIEVFFGSDVNGPGDFVSVVDGQYFATFNVNSPSADNDVAVLRLSEVAPVAPIRMGKAPSANKDVTLIGFGITSANGSGAGVKRVTDATVELLAPKTFQMQLLPGGTCNGDSGGTALFTEADGLPSFVGIHTRSDCANFMLDERVDKHVKDFIQPFIDADATCAADFGCAKGCPAPDPDCPCAADGFCTAACTTPDDDPDCIDPCASNGVCDAACTATDPDCPVCEADGTCNDACAADPDCGAGGSAATTSTGASPNDDGTHTVTECDCRMGETAPEGSQVLWPLAAAIGALAARRQRARREPPP
ncbi:MAG: trypsin-like serine protease [Polyangiaceae bacterium]